MYARMTKFVGLAPERIDATVQGFEQNALTDLAQMDGFAGVTVLVDPDQGTAAAITLWKTKEALKESEQTALQAREEAISSGQAGPRRDPITERFEVVLHKQA